MYKMCQIENLEIKMPFQVAGYKLQGIPENATSKP
jgi:hypothetical protein